MAGNILKIKPHINRTTKHTSPIQWYGMLFFPFLLCVVLFFAVRHVINQQIQDHAELTATQFYIQSSGMIREIYLYSDALVNDATFVNLINVTDANDLDTMDFCAFIRNSMSKSSYINHVYIVNDRLDSIYSDEGYFSRSSLDAILSKLGLNVSEYMPSSAFDASDRKIVNAGNISPFCFVPLLSKDGKDRIGTAIITLSSTEFLRNFYMLDASLCCIFNEDFFISSYPAQINSPRINWSNPGEVSSLLGQPVTCVYRKMSDYTYMVAISNSDYNKPLMIIIVAFLLYAAAFIAVQLFSILRMARRRKAEVSALINALPEYSGTAEYSAVLPEIRRLLKEHQEQRAKVQQQVQERNLRYILYGHSQSIISDEFIESAGIPDPFDKIYHVVCFYLRDIDSSTAFNTGKHTESMDLAHLTLRSVIEGILEPGIGFTSCADIDSLVVVFWSKNTENFNTQVLEICKKAIEILLLSYNVSTHASVSSPFTDIRRLDDAFSKTKYLAKLNSSVESQDPLMLHEEFAGANDTVISPDFIRQKQILINSILAQKYQLVPDIVQSILEKSVSPLKDLNLARIRLHSVANLLVEAILSSNVIDLSFEDITQQFNRAGTAAELNVVTQKYFSQISAIVEESATENEIIRRAREYIDTNLSDHNLNVSAICEAIDISTQRLTRLFQLHLGLTVAEYMNQQRIERSKTLLRKKPEMSVAQIAESIGYNNTHSLTRNFRKLEGLTPTEYRELRI